MGVEWLPLDRDEQVESVILQTQAILAAGRPVIVDTAIDYSDKTYFTRGVVKTMLGRLPWPDRLRFIARAISRRISG
jgi:acetolactate synthase-1/2/3 large subunit